MHIAFAVNSQRCVLNCRKQTEIQQLGRGAERFAEVAENRHSFGLDQWQVDEIIV